MIGSFDDQFSTIKIEVNIDKSNETREEVNLTVIKQFCEVANSPISSIRELKHIARREIQMFTSIVVEHTVEVTAEMGAIFRYLDGNK